MQLRNISIKWKLVSMCVLLVTIPVVTLGVWTYRSSKAEIYRSTENKLSEQVVMMANRVDTVSTIGQQKVASDLDVAHHLLYERGQLMLDHLQQLPVIAIDQRTKAATQVTIPALKIAEKQLLYHTHFVDAIQKLIGGDVAIFQVIPGGLLQISTTILQQDGSRAVGTYIPTDSPVYQAIMSGEIFHQRAYVSNSWNQIAYKPMKDAQQKIIGALYVGQQDASEMILENLAQIVVGKTGYLWALTDKGEYVLSYQRQRDGESLIEARDDTGRLFVKEWVELAPTLPKGESMIDYYSWKNPGENRARLKISAYTYFHKWGWLIGSSAYIDDFLDQIKHIRRMAIGISLAAILLGSIAAYLFVSVMVKKFNLLIRQMNEVAHGNLAVDIQTDRQDEIGMLSRALQSMAANLRQQTSKIAEGIHVLMSSTSEILASVTQLASSSAETSTSVGETVTTLEEVRQTSQLANQKAQQVSGRAQKAAQTAQNGEKATGDTIEDMNRIREQMASIAESIVKLSEQSQAIGDIISTVRDLADQSNLLAVNASIEAAKAGEQGKGFVVVAQEIRSLSEQSKQATIQVQTILSNIQKATSAAVMATEQGTKAVEAGMKQADEAGGSIQVLAESVGEAAQAMSQIAITSQEQTIGMNQIAEAMESIKQASIQNVDSSSQLEMSAQNLQELGHKLKQIVDMYTI